MIDLIFTALWWVLLVSMACSAAVTVVALGIYFYDLLHSEEQEGPRAVAGGPLSPVAARGVLGNTMGAPGAEDTLFRRSQFFVTVQREREVTPCSSVVGDSAAARHARVVELDAHRIRKANRKCR